MAAQRRRNRSSISPNTCGKSSSSKLTIRSSASPACMNRCSTATAAAHCVRRTRITPGRPPAQSSNWTAFLSPSRAPRPCARRCTRNIWKRKDFTVLFIVAADASCGCVFLRGLASPATIAILTPALRRKFSDSRAYAAGCSSEHFTHVARLRGGVGRERACPFLLAGDDPPIAKERENPSRLWHSA